MYVCMYVYIYVCIYICMYVCLPTVVLLLVVYLIENVYVNQELYYFTVSVAYLGRCRWAVSLFGIMFRFVSYVTCCAITWKHGKLSFSCGSWLRLYVNQRLYCFTCVCMISEWFAGTTCLSSFSKSIHRLFFCIFQGA